MTYAGYLYRGSKALRTASPTNTSRIVSVVSVRNVGTMIHHAARCCCPCERSSPRLGADGLLIVGSEKVSPYALREVAYLARKMLANRLDEPHLCGYDPAKAPTFRWPAEVIEAYKRYEAEQAEKQRQSE